MKRLTLLQQLILTTTVTSIGLGLAVSGGQVAAAGCVPTGTLGQITSTVNIPAAGDYVIWSRIKVPSAGSSNYQLNVDGATCFNVGGASVPPNTWTWVNYQNNSAGSVTQITFTASGNHTIQLLGSYPGVQVDRVMILKSGDICASNGSTPLGTGSNCDTTTTPVVNPPPPPPPDTSGGGGTGGSTGSGGSSSGSSSVPGTTPSSSVYVPKLLAQADPSKVAQVQYYCDGNLVQSSDKAVGLDKTLLDNGDCKLTTKVTYKDGHTATEKAVVKVHNPTGLIPTATRWLRLNRSKVLIPSTATSIVGLLAIGYFVRLVLLRRPTVLQPAEPTQADALNDVGAIVVNGVTIQAHREYTVWAVIRRTLKRVVNPRTYQSLYLLSLRDRIGLFVAIGVVGLSLSIVLVTLIVTILIY